MGKPVSLKGHMHACPMIDPGSKPHIGSPIIDTGQDFVTANGIPIATVSSIALCSGVSTTAAITSGSSIATINGKKVARLGDACEHCSRRFMDYIRLDI